MAYPYFLHRVPVLWRRAAFSAMGKLGTYNYAPFYGSVFRNFIMCKTFCSRLEENCLECAPFSCCVCAMKLHTVCDFYAWNLRRHENTASFSPAIFQHTDTSRIQDLRIVHIKCTRIYTVSGKRNLQFSLLNFKLDVCIEIKKNHQRRKYKIMEIKCPVTPQIIYMYELNVRGS